MTHKKLRERKHFTLRRDLGLVSATAAGVGIIVGAGIYVLIGAASGLSGNALWLSFLIGALVSIFTGLSYAELSSIFPKDSGEYIYTEHAFGKRLAFIIGYSVFLGGLIAAATVALGFAGYFSSLFGFNNIALIAIALITLMSFINYLGIKQGAKINILLTLLEVGGLLFIIFLSLGFIGKVNYLEMANGLQGIFQAASLIFFAFIGFEAVVKLSEETKNPKKIIPKAIMLSVAISALLYCAVAIAAVSVIDWHVLSKSASPLADVANVLLGSNAFIFLSIVALFSTMTTVLIDLIATSRTLYGISCEYKSLKACSQIDAKRRTPWLSVLITFILTLPFILIGDISLVAEITNFSIFITFFLVNSSLIWLRYKEPDVERPFKVPLNIGKFPILAALGAASCIFMMINLRWIVILSGLGLFAIGYLIYLVLERLEKKHN